MLEVLERIVDGQGTMEDLSLLRELADMIQNTALCGLGKSAPKPVISTLNAFEDEYIAHIRDKRCPAGVCSQLKVYTIDPALCKGCSKCARNCPAGAIQGTLKSPYSIDTNTCIRCGACLEQCAFGAVSVAK
jgi:NADH-quinone oxidoreductase subunit F